jgi:hypothetical protein
VISLHPNRISISEKSARVKSTDQPRSCFFWDDFEARNRSWKKPPWKAAFSTYGCLGNMQAAVTPRPGLDDTTFSRNCGPKLTKDRRGESFRTVRGSRYSLSSEVIHLPDLVLPLPDSVTTNMHRTPDDGNHPHREDHNRDTQGPGAISPHRSSPSSQG